MLEWLLILYVDDNREYIGNFESCAHATQYFQECVKGDYQSWSTACLHQDYVQLPQEFKPIYRDWTCK